MTKDKPRKIHGRAFLAWLSSFGIIPEDANYVRVEASWDSAVEITVGLYGTTEMIKDVPPPELREAEVTILGEDDVTGAQN